MKSDEIRAKIAQLHKLERAAQTREARAEIKKIFGHVPRGLVYADIDPWDSVAMIYVTRAYKQRRRERTDEYMWIRLWHECSPESTPEQLLNITDAYIACGCGMAG